MLCDHVLFVYLLLVILVCHSFNCVLYYYPNMDVKQIPPVQTQISFVFSAVTMFALITGMEQYKGERVKL